MHHVHSVELLQRDLMKLYVSHEDFDECRLDLKRLKRSHAVGNIKRRCYNIKQNFSVNLKAFNERMTDSNCDSMLNQ